MKIRYIVFLAFFNIIFALTIQNKNEDHENKVAIQNNEVNNLNIQDKYSVNTYLLNDNNEIENPKTFFEIFKNLDIIEKIIILIEITISGFFGLIIGFYLLPFIIIICLLILGFSPTGIVLGSIASWIMSLYGGSIAAGSLFSILQSMGALGYVGLLGTFVPYLNAIIGMILSEIILFRYILI